MNIVKDKVAELKGIPTRDALMEQLEKEVKNFDFVDIETLNVYLDDQKRILPRRVTELSIRNQRRLTKAVKRARLLGLLPFTVQAEY